MSEINYCARDPNIIEALALIEQSTLKQRENRDFAIKVVSLMGDIIDRLSIKFRDDEEIMRLAIENGASLELASTRLKSNYEFVSVALNRFGANLEWASDDLRDSERVVITAVTNNPRVLQFASERLRKDKIFIRKLVKISRYVLLGASSEILCNKKFILDLIESEGENFYASEEIFQNDNEIINSALRANGANYSNLPYELRDNLNLYLMALDCDKGRSANFLLAAPDSIRSNRRAIVASIKSNWKNILFAKNIENDADVILLAIRSQIDTHSLDDQAMQYASDELKNNKEFLRNAIYINWICFAEASVGLKSDVRFVTELSKIDSRILQFTNIKLDGATNCRPPSSTHLDENGDGCARTSIFTFGRWKELTSEQKAASAAKKPPILYQTSINHTEFSIDEKKINYGDLILNISEITGLRWGRHGNINLNRVFQYAIFFSSSEIGKVNIEWTSQDNVDGEKFKMIAHWLTKVVSPKLISDIRVQFYRNEVVSIGNLVCSKEGIRFVTTGFFGTKERVCPWRRLGTEISDGVIEIFDTTNQKAKVSLKLSEVENAFVLHNFPRV